MNRKALVEKKFPEHAKAALKVEDYSRGKNKYLLWIAQQLKNGYNIEDIDATIKFFHENPSRFEEKDIHKYKDLKNLEDLIKDMGLSRRQEKEKNKESAHKIFENDEFLCIRVDDKPAMIAYGANTKWCTTMKDHHYYEDYVNNGNDFYILILKKSKKERTGNLSDKYAIVRKGLLEFQIYDAQDTYHRSFTDEEEDVLRQVVQAIVVDKPPKNYLKLVCDGTVLESEAVEWLRHQSSVTKTYVEGKRPDLRLLTKTADELIEIFIDIWQRKHMHSMNYDRIKNMAETLCQKNAKRYSNLKIDVVRILKGDDVLLFQKDSDAKVRAQVATLAGQTNASKFFDDRALSVVKNAAHQATIDYLFDFTDETKSTRKRKVVNEVIIERISQEKVRKFILEQPRDIIKGLMI